MQNSHIALAESHVFGTVLIRSEGKTRASVIERRALLDPSASEFVHSTGASSLLVLDSAAATSEAPSTRRIVPRRRLQNGRVYFRGSKWVVRIATLKSTPRPAKGYGGRSRSMLQSHRRELLAVPFSPTWTTSTSNCPTCRQRKEKARRAHRGMEAGNPAE